MIQRYYDDEDGNPVIAVDNEGAQLLVAGLAKLLRECAPGETMETETFITQDGQPEGVGKVILLREPDE